MLLTVTPLEDPGPPSPSPPPTAPKPAKDNARLQRLLRKAAKRSGVQQQPTQPPKSFRSTLSPVSEGDLESLEPATPKKHVPLSLILPPRFQIKTVTHRVPSPYPKHRNFTFTVSEQQSISQYLSSPTPRDTPSPRPTRAITPTVNLVINTLNATPQQVSGDDPNPPSNESSTFKSTHSDKAATTNPLVSNDMVTCNGNFFEGANTKAGQLTLNTEDNSKKSQSDTFFTNTEIGYCTLKLGDTNSDKTVSNLRTSTEVVVVPRKSFQVEQESDTNKASACYSPASVKTKQFAVSPVMETTEKNACLSTPSRGTDIPDIIISSDSGNCNVLTEMQLTENHKTPNVTDLPKESGPAPSKYAPKSHKTQITHPLTSSSPTGNLAGIKPLSEKPSTTEEMNLLKNPDRAKPLRKKPGRGWARLMKHLVVEPDEPKFPESQRTDVKEETSGDDIVMATDVQQPSRSSRANKMWDALLYHMATTPKGQEKTGPGSEAPPPLPFLRSRLPLLLHRPRFDARKLKEAASRPLRRVTAFFHRKTGEKPATSFNRTASGWSIRGEDAENS
ncbi:Hypothetical predicted protein [Pelobates cultripes]|uniref:Uncharacterized protein n=1 Tax=Pelobates cultripes TaxID=61616 RepID=A0AAD1TGC3_PELCU|nr:Hypothetical predicted protein [Pelobates cultripes]